MELDNPVWWALRGPQRILGMAVNDAARFVPEISPFGGFAGEPGPRDWRIWLDLRVLGQRWPSSLRRKDPTHPRTDGNPSGPARGSR